MREAHPLLYQQVDGNGFFTTHGNVTKQVRLFHYIKSKEYHHHYDEIFTGKCERVSCLCYQPRCLHLPYWRPSSCRSFQLSRTRRAWEF